MYIYIDKRLFSIWAVDFEELRRELENLRQLL